VIGRELFGGSGGMWGTLIEDKGLRIKFENHFCKFVDLLKEMGIKNRRVN
jgi:hypothetical protein